MMRGRSSSAAIGSNPAETRSDMTSSNTLGERYPQTGRPDSVGAAHVPPAGVPAYYLGRPAEFWMAIFRPRPRPGASRPPAVPQRRRNAQSEET